MSRQDMTSFGRGFSGNAQLFWAPSRAGATLDVQVPIAEAGAYELVVTFTKAPDYGTVSVSLAGRQLATFNGFAASVVAGGRVGTGRLNLPPGPLVLTFTVTGKDSRSSGLLVGIDKVDVTKAATPVRTPDLDARPVIPDRRERRFTAVVPYPVRIKPLEVPKIPASHVDLRPRIQQKNIQIRNQLGRGTCSVFAVTFLLEYQYCWRKNLSLHDLSEEYLNYATNLVKGQKGDGDFFDNIDKGYQKWGSYPEALVPYKTSYDPSYAVPKSYMEIGSKWEKFAVDFIKEWNPKTGASDAQIQKVIQYLDNDTPVAAGLLWPDAQNFKTEVVSNVDILVVPPKSGVYDGHSVAIVGYLKHFSFPGGGIFYIRNSWGPGWGDQGYAYIPFEYLKNYANDLVAYH